MPGIYRTIHKVSYLAQPILTIFKPSVLPNAEALNIQGYTMLNK